MLHKFNNARPAFVLIALYAIAIPMLYAQMGMNGIYFLIGASVFFVVANAINNATMGRALFS